MIRILHISANQFPSIEVEHHTKKIWRELAKDADEYHVFARAYNNRFERYREGNIILHLIPAMGKRERSFLLSSFLIFYIIPRYGITHLLAQNPLSGGLSAVLASKLYGIPVMVEIHGDVFFKYFRKKSWSDRILAFLAKFSLKNATVVRSLSPEMTRLLVTESIRNNVAEVPNRVDLQLFQPPKTAYRFGETIKIVSVGRFVRQKGYDLAIQAVHRLGTRHPVELYLIGGGALYEELEQQASGNPDIHLIRWMDQKDLIPFLRTSDIYIQPSVPYFGEAMPRTILEAMAMGLPVIASEIAAIPGVLEHGVDALLIQPGSAIEIEMAVEKLIFDENLRKQLGKNAFNKAKTQYEWNRSFDRYRAVLYGMKD